MQLRNLQRTAISALLLAGSLGATGTASAATVAITEWMYNGDEFIEFTNLTGSAVDFTGWSFDDNSRTPGSVSLSGFGLVAAGESVILSEASAATFRTTWGLAASVKVIGGNSNNLGRADEINLYDASNALVDRLTYDDQSFAGTIRTLNISGNPGNLSVLDLDTVTTAWVLSATGDAYGSYSAGAFVANPGTFALTPVPVPAALPLMLGALGGLAAFRRRAG